jgi:hypothetical protein
MPGRKGPLLLWKTPAWLRECAGAAAGCDGERQARVGIVLCPGTEFVGENSNEGLRMAWEQVADAEAREATVVMAVMVVVEMEALAWTVMVVVEAEASALIVFVVVVVIIESEGTLVMVTLFGGAMELRFA